MDLWKNARANSVEAALPEDFYRRIAENRICRNWLPPAADRDFWAKLAAGPWKKQEAEKFIAQADVLLRKPLETLSTYDYMRFVLEGDRARFERTYLARRNDLGALILARCFSGDKEKYFPAIVDRLGAITAEPYWCIHAHALRDSDPMPIPATAHRPDIFAAETAQLFALALQIMGDELEALSPRFLRTIKNAVLEKTVRPMLERFEDAAFLSWACPERAANWTIWCACNILQAGIACLADPVELADLARKLNRSAARFFDCCPENGFCTEGPGYWTKAAVAFCQYLEVLDRMQPGAADALYASEKVRNMGEFGARAAIFGCEHVTSGDCGHIDVNGFYRTGILVRFADRIHSPLLRDFALRRVAPPPHCRTLDPNDPTVRIGTGDLLNSALEGFFYLPETPETAPAPLLAAHDLWPDRLGILRHPAGFSAALKAGDNAEAHNHNDLGHFTLYDRDRPLVIDLGTGFYSRQNFSPDRYKLLCTSARGHNAPLFDGVGEVAGKDARATLVLPSADRLRADLGQAYPAEAGVRQFTRELVCHESETTVTDTFELEKAAEACVTLLSIQPVKMRDEHTLDFGGGVTCELAGYVCTGVEAMPLSDIPRHWGDFMVKITLRAEASPAAMTFRHNA